MIHMKGVFVLMRALSPRNWFFLGFLFCVGLMLSAFYFQFVGKLDPCPLCISQRIMVVAVGLVMLAAAIHNPGSRGIKIYAGVAGMTALAGAGISARHVWIQHLPASEVPACGPGLSYMFRYFPLTDTLRAMVTGTGDCAKVDWTLLGFSMPFWVLVCFLGLAVVAFAQFGNLQDRR
jgi:disulfide bond formation protein DsbB